jgi:type I restriction enzyme R subunit
MVEAGYTETQIEKIKKEVDHFEKARMEVKLASGDYIDLKMYEPAMRHLIDTYIRAEESRKISAFDDMNLVKLIVERGEDAIKELPAGIAGNPAAMAETIENNLRRVIIDEQPINPKYYEKMSNLLDALIQERKEKDSDYEDYLKKLVTLAKQVDNPSGGFTYPKSLNTAAKRALYDNLGNNEELAVLLNKAIIATRKDNWRGNVIKEREVLYAIQKHVTDDAEAERVFELVKNQVDY